MISSRRLIALWATFFTTLAASIDSQLASRTYAADDLAGLLVGQMPLPTSPPPILDRRDDNLNTCGYTNGNSGSPNVCPAGQECTVWSGWDYQGFACCSTSNGNFVGDCYDRVAACVPWTAAQNFGFAQAGAIVSQYGILNSVFCGYSYSNCATSYIDGILDYVGEFTHYDCVNGPGATVYLSKSPTQDVVVTTTQTSTIERTTTAISVSISQTVSVLVSEVTVHDTAVPTTISVDIASPTSTQDAVSVMTVSAGAPTSTSTQDQVSVVTVMAGGSTATTTSSGTGETAYPFHAGLAGLAVAAGFFGL